MLKIKASSIVSKYKYELSAFVLLIFQACLDIDFRQGMDRNFYSYYLADFSMGRTSRLLIGSLVNLLTDKPTVLWINCFAAVVLVLTFAFTSLLIGKIIKAADNETRPVIAVFSLFFVSGAFTFRGFSSFFGILDIYMYLFAVLSLVIVRNKAFRWFIPLICIGGLLVNYIFIFSYYPIIALVLLYLIATEEKKTANVIILLVSAILMAVLTFYCLIIGKTTATMPFEDMWQAMENKLGTELEYENVSYYKFYLYGEHLIPEGYGININDSVSDFAVAFTRFLKENAFNAQAYFKVAIGAVPVLIVFWAVWMRCIKKAETKIKKLVYLCFMISPVFALICCLLSTDIARWAAPGIMTQFMLGYFMFAVKDKPFAETVAELKEKLRGKAFAVVILWAVYASFRSIYTIIG